MPSDHPRRMLARMAPRGGCGAALCLALLVGGTGAVHAQTLAPFADYPLSEILVPSPPPVEPYGEHAMPAIPIFFGHSVEGRLSLADGAALTRYGASLDKAGELKAAPAVAFEIDLVEGESMTFGGRVGTNLFALAHFFREETGVDGRVAWQLLPDWSSGLSSGSDRFHCIQTVMVRQSGRYRIELTGNAAYRIDYRFFILPDRQREPTPRPLCGVGHRLLAPAVPYFNNPGRPVSLELARRWEGQAPVFEFASPPALATPPSAEAVAYARDKPEALRPFYQALYVDAEHNAVLNFQKLGLAAMQLGRWAEAEWAFDEALHRIEQVYGRTAVAEAARSKWIKEGIKDFKGEPHERAMAYYYRGLLYLRAGDYENARATFMAGEFQDTLSEAERFQGDFALLNFLSGWASHCMGDEGLAHEAFAAAAAVDPALRRPATGDNTLAIADLGRGPVKLTRGSRGAFLGFADAIDSGRDERVSVTLGDGRPQPLHTAADLHLQATTRGGRAFGAVLDGKARFQDGLSRASDVSFALAQSGSAPLAVAGLVGGAVIGLVGGKVKPDADVRTWDTLPRHVALATTVADASTRLEFSFTDAGGSLVTGASSQPVMRDQAGRCAIAWSRSRPVLEMGAGVPGNDADIVKARSKNKEAVAKDEAFRAALRSQGG